MARLPRLYVPDIPQLAQAEFLKPLAGPADPTPAAALDQMLIWLREEARNNGVALHGWLLQNDRVTILATGKDARAISRLIQGLGRRMAAGMRHGRVFKGRYRSALIEPGVWLLPTLLWLESLPVQGRYVDTPTRWPWSSAAIHAGLASRAPDLVTDHNDYWLLGNTPYARQASYRTLLEHGLGDIARKRIEAALFGQWALGSQGFLDSIKDKASRRIAPAARGRPRKQPASDSL